jgi:putative ABC transport system permease protein
MRSPSDVLYDARFACRAVVRSPSVTAAAVFTLALGVGLNTAVFSVVESLLLRQLPYGAPDRIVALTLRDSNGAGNGGVDAGLVRRWAARTRTLESLGIHGDSQLLLHDAGDTEVMRGTRVSADYFDTLRVHMLLGRTFQAGEDRLDPAAVLILTHDYWVRRFGQDPTIIGRTLDVDGGPYRVVGVLPERFGPLRMTNPAERPEYFAPASYDCDQCEGFHRVIGRLKPEVTPQQAQADLNAVTRRLEHEGLNKYPPGTSVIVEPLLDQLVGPIRPALWTVFGAVSLVLLIACANVASLQLARATTRSREFAVRMALGGPRGRIAGQLLIENLVVAGLGGAAGLLAARAGTSTIVAFAPKALPRIDEIRIDSTVLMFTLVTTVVTGVVFGVLPAWAASRVDVNNALKRAAGVAGRASGARVRNVLVVVDLVLAFVLVLTTSLLAKSFRNLTTLDAGFEPDNVLTMTPAPVGTARERDPEDKIEHYRRILERIRAVHGVTAAGMASNVPLSNVEPEAVRTEHDSALRDEEVPPADLFWVSPGYLEAMRIPLRRGRVFSDADNVRPAASAIVSEAFARQRLPGEDPIGRRIEIVEQNPVRVWLTIVGVVADARYAGLDRPGGEAVYLPQSQRPNHYTRIVARTAANPMMLAPAIRAAVTDTDPAETTFHVQAMTAYVSSALADRSFVLALIAMFGSLALLLAGVGVYSVVSQAVAHRTAELGIRAALGATPRALLLLVLRQGVALTAIGLLGGIAAALAAVRVVSALLYGVWITDPAVPVATAAVLAAITLAATYIPARSAMRTDPITALRSWHTD